jgi:RHH-type proline utilization regulon transcriptional repressor/proline dehydrogenase/delta 1-pyrroline-5-carboxylate dehydrogenase
MSRRDPPPELTGEAVALASRWLSEGETRLTRAQRRRREQLRRMTGDPASLAYAMAFCDRVLRPESNATAAREFRSLASRPVPDFLSPADRLLLHIGSRAAGRLPGIVMPLTRRRLRQLVGDLVVAADERSITRHLRRLRAAGFDVNVNLLGEQVLGEQEANRRRDAIRQLILRGDVDYVSVKASSVASQLTLWDYAGSVDRVAASLRPLYRTAAATTPPTFVNLDMEEYRDLRLTVDAFTRVLNEPELRSLYAGIVLQAYLPEALAVLEEVTDWAQQRRADGGAPVKVRIVKGANLAMESVEAELNGWIRGPYAHKAETDANYLRMLDRALQPERIDAVHIGVASHNLFDQAYAHLLAERRGVSDRVDAEMLHGIAPGIDRVVRDATGSLRLYVPVVATADFDNALAYLFRRLEESSSPENYLRSLFDAERDPAAMSREEARFRDAVAARYQVTDARRRAAAPVPADGFHNAPATDPTSVGARQEIVASLTQFVRPALPAELVQTADIDRVLERAALVAPQWAATPADRRARLLRQVAAELAGRRPYLLALMAHEGNKTLGEGDPEVSEAVDLAAYYATRVPGLAAPDAPEAAFSPLGTVLVAPPWNFPLAIPAGGVFAALAAGNAVILKPPPQTPGCAFAVAEAVWAACRICGVPPEALQYVRCPEVPTGSYLVSHERLDGIVLTGARATADLFAELAPHTPLFAETSGKNAIVIMPDADLELAVADLVASAFGHAGQKCSAASLAICVGEVYASSRFRRMLVDAASTLACGRATDPATTFPPLIEAPGEALDRALNRLDPGESWLLQPHLLDAGTADVGPLWSPGIRAGVRAGSWFHRTECFGPVLGLMHARDLDGALRLQNGVAYGLTGGLHTLDPDVVDRWLERVQVGNAYVNRVTTGAVVRRQPFGGWKASVVGPGAKAGGPNYVAQLGVWSDQRLPERVAEPGPAVAALMSAMETGLGEPDRQLLHAAAGSDAYWIRRHFGIGHDPSGLRSEANIFRYRPLGRVVVRVEADARPADAVRVLVAAVGSGCTVQLSLAPGARQLPTPGLSAVTESAEELAKRLLARPPERVRVIGTCPAQLRRLTSACYVDTRPVVADGRVELLRYHREQAISRTMHRYGSVTERR